MVAENVRSPTAPGATTTESVVSGVAPLTDSGTWKTIVSEPSELRMDRRTVVPTAMRTSGAGTVGARFTSPNVASSRPGFDRPSGYHIARFASRASVSTEPVAAPAAVVLGLSSAIGNAGA